MTPVVVPPARPVTLQEIAAAELVMATPVVIGGGPLGNRVVVELLEGRFEGRLAGRLVGRSGADWITVGPDGCATLDVRLVIETDDGASIYVQSRGRTDLSPDHAAEPSMLATTFETAAAKYAWLNTTVALTRADTAGSQLHYSVYAALAD
jgi:hypothetical protein